VAEHHMHEIEIETLMNQISFILENRRRGDPSAEVRLSNKISLHNGFGDDRHSLDQNVTKFWQYIKKIQIRLQKYAFYDFLYFKIAVKLKKIIPKYRASFTVEYFLKFEDAEFIRHVYWEILGREGDSDGFYHYLEKLRNHEFSKPEILIKFRYSREGREQGVKIKGMLRMLLTFCLYQVPILGKLLRRQLR
jgi:Domain of unknown function (DUF4214)